MKIKTRRYYLYIFARIGMFFIAILPLKVGLYLGHLVGGLIYKFSDKERRNATQNLKKAFPEKTDAEIERIAREAFSNVCKNAIEWINSYKLTEKTADKWVIHEDGLDKIRQVLAKGKGGILLPSHIGNWELISLYFPLKGCYGTVIVRRIYFDGYDKFINKMRTSRGTGIIYRDESPKKILRLLKKGKLIGILADQDMDSVDGVCVNFFGRPAYTPKAPVVLSAATGAPLIPCFVIREKNGHRVIVEDPIEVIDKGDKEETIKFNTQRWSDIIESYIKKYPEQWVWMHKRWKTKPRASETHDSQMVKKA